MLNLPVVLVRGLGTAGGDGNLHSTPKKSSTAWLKRPLISMATLCDPPSIITSLWKVDDLATAVMVKRFYRYLRDGLPRAEALRQAQLLVMRSVDNQPAAWAAFGLTGDFR